MNIDETRLCHSVEEAFDFAFENDMIAWLVLDIGWGKVNGIYDYARKHELGDVYWIYAPYLTHADLAAGDWDRWKEDILSGSYRVLIVEGANQALAEDIQDMILEFVESRRFDSGEELPSDMIVMAVLG